MSLVQVFRFFLTGAAADRRRHEVRMLVTTVVIAEQAFAAMTEFILSILIFLTAAAVMVALSRAPDLRFTMAPLVCPCTTPRTAATELAPFCAPLMVPGLSGLR